jgi:hypothetical protein
VAHRASGRQLDAFESWQTAGGRRYGGLFRNGAGNRWLYANLDAVAFAARRQQQFDLGRRLIDIEVQLVEGERRFSGLWAPGSGPELYFEDSAAAFEARWNGLAASYHLVAFDSWWSDALGEPRVFGVFAGGAEPEGAALAVGRSLDDFESLLGLNGIQGKRLVDFEATALGSDQYLSGRWVPAPPARNWLGVFYSNDVLTVSDMLFKSGHEFSAWSISPNSYLPPPTASRMDLLDLEVTGYLVNGTIIHGMPLHDAGTPGPPRPGGGG